MQTYRVTGWATLPLHWGKMPSWLFAKMKVLAGAISEIIINEYGCKEFLNRLASPYWFQAFGCVLGFDWHSSGLTTTVLGALREALEQRNLPIRIAGGKGKKSLKTPKEIVQIADEFGLSESTSQRCVYASKLVAKTDNAVLQDAYHLYHHCFVLDEKGNWAVIQQGMNCADRTARRYHWAETENFLCDPNREAMCDRQFEIVLNMSSSKSAEAQKTSLDLVKGSIPNLKRDLERAKPKWLELIAKATKGKRAAERSSELEILQLPRNLNWNALRQANQAQPSDYEQLVGIEGIGPAAIRALALISKLIYGSRVDWRDPVRFSFAHGGKDGVPYPVDKRTYQTSIGLLQSAIDSAKISEREKLQALSRLRFYFRI